MRLRQKFCDSHVKFVRNSHEFRANFTFSEYSHNSIHLKFARNSHEFRTNLVRGYVNFLKLHANHSRESCLREGDGGNLAMTASPFNRSCISHHAADQGAIPPASGSYTTATPTRAPASCYQGACSTLHRQVPARHGANSAYPRKKSCSHRPARFRAHLGGEVDYGRPEDPVIEPL